jgi:hypothetical protein
MGSREGPARSVSGWAPASDELDAKFELVVVRQERISVAMFADTSKVAPLLKQTRGYYVRPREGCGTCGADSPLTEGPQGHAAKRMHIHGSSLGQISVVRLPMVAAFGTATCAFERIDITPCESPHPQRVPEPLPRRRTAWIGR